MKRENLKEDKIKDGEIVVEFIGDIQHFYERGDDLIVLPKGRASGENMYPYGQKVKVTIELVGDGK